MDTTDRCIHCTNLRLKYPGSETVLLHNVSFTIQRGEVILITGPTGCGKSTLLHVLAGLVPYVLPMALRYDEWIVPEKTALVVQDPPFCMAQVIDELAFVLENAQVDPATMPARIHEALETVGLGAIDPETEIERLSPGQKQRLAIACAWISDPDVVLLDEPTALIDRAGRHALWHMLQKTLQGKTVVIVEHQLDDVIDWVDRIFLFNAQGQLLLQTTPTSFVRDRTLLQQQGIWYPGIWEEHRLTRPSRSFCPAKQPTINFIDFVAFREKRAVARVPTTQIAPGSWIAIVGENGSGKTTLLRAMMQLLPTNGGMSIDHKPIRNVRCARQQMAFVFQQAELQFLTDCVQEEIGYLRPPHDPLIATMMQQCGLVGMEQQHPFQLSFGQKRRVSLACALMGGQNILLLDEPTCGQDAHHAFAILRLLERMRNERSDPHHGDARPFLDRNVCNASMGSRLRRCCAHGVRTQ